MSSHWKWGCRLCGKRMQKRHALGQHLTDCHKFDATQVKAELSSRATPTQKEQSS